MILIAEVDANMHYHINKATVSPSLKIICPCYEAMLLLNH